MKPIDLPHEVELQQVDWVLLGDCNVGDKLRLWQKPGSDLINAYAPWSTAGNGRIATLLRSKNTDLATCMDQGHSLWLLLKAFDEKSCRVTLQREDIEAVIAARIESFLTPYRRTPQEFKAELRFGVGGNFFAGDTLYFHAGEIHEYAKSSLTKLHFFDAGAMDRSPYLAVSGPERTKVLRANFCGYRVQATVIMVASNTKIADYDGNLIEEKSAKVNVTFSL